MKIHKTVQMFIDLEVWDEMVEELRAQNQGCSIQNTIIYLMSVYENRPYTFLDLFLSWRQTRNGFSYWSNICEKLIEMEQKKRRNGNT